MKFMKRFRLKPEIAAAVGPAPEQACPICGGQEFQDFRNRPLAQCSSCKSLERARLVWLVLNRQMTFRRGMKILHIAPEHCIQKQFEALSGENYLAGDLHPENYRGRVIKIDLTKDLDSLPMRGFHLVLHNHVLEHLPVDPIDTVKRLNTLLAPDGVQAFTVPFRGPVTREDLSPDLSDDERTRLFGQRDHLRLFGTRDFPEALNEAFGSRMSRTRPETLFSEEELRRAMIPERSWRRIDGTTLFMYKAGSE